MARSRISHRGSVRNLLAITICFALMLSSLVLGLPKLSPASAQGNNNSSGGNGRKGERPQPVNGPVGAELPTTDLVLNRPRHSAPQILPVIPSTQPRYRHPRLGNRGTVNGQASTGTSPAKNHEGMKSVDSANAQAEKSANDDDSGVLPATKSAKRLSESRSRVSGTMQPAVERSHARASHPLLPQNPFDFPAAMLDPHNRIGGGGEELLSGNYNWALDILSLKGRTGLDLGLSLSYNSLATWVRSNNYIDFDYDNGFPTPGFRLSFPVVDGYLYYNSQAGAYYYLLFTSSGARIELRRVSGSSNVYEAVDSSYLELTDYGSYLLLRSRDGSQLKLYYSMGQYRCTEVKDRNGNFITINYNSYDTLSISTIRDTLGRTINFNYDLYGNLSTITQQWSRDVATGGQQTETHTWANFSYGTQYIANNFSGMVVYGPVNQNITVLTAVNLPDGSQYTFEYNSYGQVKKINCKWSYGGVLTMHNYVSYDLPTNSSDCPRISARHDWAAHWNGDTNEVPATNEEAITTFGSDGGSARWMGAPDGTVYKEFYGSGWQTGLPQSTEFWDWVGTKQKWTTTSWTQDNTGANPRVTETNVYDGPPTYNRRRTTIDYYATFGLPSVVTEYDANASGVIRFILYGYKNDDAFVSRRIIGLPYQTYVFDGSWNLYSKVQYEYDWHDGYMTAQAPSVQHDTANYGSSFDLGRGFLTGVRRFNINASDDTNQAVWVLRRGYNLAGAVTFTKDASNHQTNLSYSDSFSETSKNSLNTIAYPTTVTDADGYSSTIQYNYDLGVAFRTQGPPPTNPITGQPYTQWGAQKTYYDSAGRTIRVLNEFNSAYRSFYYDYNYLLSWASVNNVADEALSLKYFDGHDRVFASLVNHPGSTGGYSGQWTFYDVMGRVSNQSTPTEINGGWQAVGDDATQDYSFPRWIARTYDWKGRPLRTTNPDGTYKEASYAGCGCAGGEVVTVIDEVGRKQKIYSDAMGRTAKTEIYEWNGTTVYSSTTNKYNALDQVTRFRQYVGSAPAPEPETEGSGYQTTNMTYDGHGRLSSKHVPEQDAATATTWTYNPDDTVLSVTDARNASTTYGYNNRHLVTAINYSAPSGITPTANVTYGYDPAGNRTSMTDGLGSKSYSYNQLSQLTSETRSLAGVGSYTLTYDYNLAGQLKKITDSTNTTINYGFDPTGRLSAVTGSDNLVGGVSNYSSGFQYRAWGALKQVSIGGSHTSSVAYNARLQAINFNISGGVANQNYDYHDDGRLSFVHNTTDINFDSSFSFDHAGRLTEAATGGAARHDTGPVPMYETFQYNVWGHTTNRVSESWLNDFYDSASYTNGRRDGWTYDADGRVATIDTRSYTYDVAGKIRSLSGQRWTLSGTYVPTSTTSDFDGDGQKVRETSDASGSTITTYYLRSSVLSGEIVEELNSSGQKQLGYVYTPAGGLIARQVPALNYVMLKQSSPTGVSQREFFKSDTVSGMDTRQEFDPLGANIRLGPGPVGHGGGAGDIHSGSGGPSDNRFGAIDNPAGGCISLLDGVPTPCDWINRMGNSGALQLRVGTTKFDIQLLGGSTVWVDAWEEYFKPGTGFIGYDENGMEKYDAGATIIRNVGYFITIPGGGPVSGTPGQGVLPQEPRPAKTPTPPDPCVTAAFAAVQKGRQTPDANKAISSLLSEAKTSGLTAAQSAYVLATAEWESNMGNSMYEPKGYAAKKAYGVKWRGRGYVHLTGITNYRKFGVADNPSLAADPATAARIAVQGMMDGAFTGNSLEAYIPDDGEPDFYNARWTIIGQTRHERGVAGTVAGYANDFLNALKGCRWGQ